jgi:hypothetical protein
MSVVEAFTIFKDIVNAIAAGITNASVLKEDENPLSHEINSSIEIIEGEIRIHLDHN